MNKKIKTALLIIISASVLLLFCSCVENDEKSAGTSIGTNLETSVGANSDSNVVSSSKTTIEEQKCFEYDGLTVFAKEYVSDTIWGDGIKFSLENNSDKNYSVGIDAVVVNNCMVTCLFSCDVAAGKKANDTLTFSSSELEDAGIKKIGQIEIYFYVFDSASFETVYEAQVVTLKTSFYDSMETYKENDGQILYDSEGIRIIGKKISEDVIFGPSLLLYVENNTDKKIVVSCDNVSVNGYMVSALFSSDVFEGKYTFDDISFLSNELEENGITEIEQIELKFRIYEKDTFKAIAETEQITFNAK